MTNAVVRVLEERQIREKLKKEKAEVSSDPPL